MNDLLDFEIFFFKLFPKITIFDSLVNIPQICKCKLKF